MNELERFILARWAYSVGMPILSDSEYSVLLNYITLKDPNNEYLQRSWSSDPCPVALLRKHDMESYIQAIIVTDKTESIPSLDTLAAVRGEYLYLDQPVTLSYKHDGWNIQASYYNGVPIHIQTRGRTSDAMVVEHLMQMIPQRIDRMGRVTVIMEATASNSAFQFAKKQFGNVSQRGCVSTFLANKEYTDMLSLHAFKIRCDQQVNDFATLNSWGFNTPMNTVVGSYEELIAAIRSFAEYKEQYEFPTDGLVVAGASTKAVRIMAWESPIYRSYVMGYEEEFGPQYCSVGARIYPIKLPNSTQVSLPITNLARVISMDLQVGRPIAFRQVSSAISAIDEETTKLLNKTYKGFYEKYQLEIEEEERLKAQLL